MEVSATLCCVSGSPRVRSIQSDTDAMYSSKLSDNVPEFWRFGLQAGSVLLWEPPQEQRLYPTLT